MSQKTKATLYPTLALLGAVGAVLLLVWVLPLHAQAATDSAIAPSTGADSGGLWGWIRSAILSQLDPVLAWLATLLLGISAIGTILARYLPRIRRLTEVLSDLLALFHELLNAVEDGKITAEEVREIRASIGHILDELKSGLLSPGKLPERVREGLGL